MKISIRLFCGSVLMMTTLVAAAGEKALMKTLKEREGKVATVVLASGAEMTGKVTSVSESTLRLGELSGKEFYDAVIDLDHVQAVVVRVRQN